MFFCKYDKYFGAFTSKLLKNKNLNIFLYVTPNFKKFLQFLIF